MTCRLILVRHAKSSWKEPELSDHDRPLNARGRENAARMGAWIAAQGPPPACALVSTARRAVQTCELMQPALPDLTIHRIRSLYHAPAPGILACLRGATGGCVMLIGHNPGLAVFAQKLITTRPDHPAFENYPTCAVALIALPVETWAALDWGMGRIAKFKVPRDVGA